MKVLKLMISLGILLGSLTWAQLPPVTSLSGKAMGPNMGVSLSGGTPFVTGVWIPQASGIVNYTFIEPLGDVRLGSAISPDSRFLRFGLSGHISPWYSMFETQFGFRVLPRFELACNYQVLSYHNSNVEQGAGGAQGNSNLAETWRSDYFFDHLYDDGTPRDYSQSFGFIGGLDLSFSKMMAGAEYRLYLIDVRTTNSGKNLDLPRMIPVHKRDFFFEVLQWGRFPMSKDLSLDYQGIYQQTGFFTTFFGDYDKEPVQQVILYAGPSALIKKSSHRVSLQPGYFWRPSKFSDATIAESFLIRVIWEGNWNWSRN